MARGAHGDKAPRLRTNNRRSLSDKCLLIKFNGEEGTYKLRVITGSVKLHGAKWEVRTWPGEATEGCGVVVRLLVGLSEVTAETCQYSPCIMWLQRQNTPWNLIRLSTRPI